MRVGIVLHPFGNSEKGLEQYIFESTRSMIEASKDETSFTVFVKGNPDTSGLPKGVRIVTIPHVFYWRLFLALHYTSCDVFIFFTESAPLFLWRKSVIVFFDAAYYYFGGTSVLFRMERCFLVLWRSWMMRLSQHVVTISEASKKDLVEIFSVPENHVSVIYPGFKSLYGDLAKNASTNHELYFMYVGPIKERKNVFAIIEAFDTFMKMGNFSHHLLLVGRKTKGTYEKRVAERIALSEFKDSITFKTSVSDESLVDLYAHAEALVFPSLLEGFGLPVLEALSVGCAVITSNTTSTKEALGNAGILVNPYDIEDIARAMKRIAEKGYDREAFVKNGYTQVSKFSWERSGTKWNSILLRCVGE